MPYVYFLRSKKDRKMYIGSTKYLRKRIYAHIKGQVPSTKNRRPFTIIGWRKFNNIVDTVLWEKKYKKSHGQLKRDIRNKKIYLYKGSSFTGYPNNIV